MRKLVAPPLDHIGKIIAYAGVSANTVTLVGLAIGLSGAGLIALGYYWFALVLVVLSRIADGLDGAVARATKPSDFGGYFDIVADFLFYGAVPLGFAFANQQQNGLVAAVLLLAFYVNGATFLGYAILAERLKLQSSSNTSKTIYFSAGLLEGTETIAFIIIICLWPSLFAPLGMIFAALTFFTAFARVLAAHKLYEPAKP
ncbi:Putative phosphatidylglycerophosphate synthase [hydrothermal vent metagenome]|uniref:Phosphatidylglycerophosphate synthase n=1 Tax=hydrothermal vent metagenome TaxID=652676 RepID=A0A3B0U622_9ZZZZ